VAALVGDRVTLALGIHHTAYPIIACPTPGFTNLATAILAGCLFGLMARVFSRANHRLAGASKRWIPLPPLRLAAGGAIVAGAVWLLGTTRHIGLGIPTIEASFAGPLAWWDFVMKSLLTTITLGFGFKGGEVTPLFFIGATMGNALSHILALPLPVLAGMGFVAVFAGAANTPLACTVMAMELFGASIGPFAAVACVCAYLCSGHTGIYRAQRIGQPKIPQPGIEPGMSLETAALARRHTSPEK
jgi:H+/Cl- antiporter ClcA